MPNANYNRLLTATMAGAILALLQLVCVLAGEANQKVSLRINFKQGKERIIHVKTSIVGQMQLVMNGAGRRTIESDIVVNGDSRFTETVKLVGADGEGLIELKVREIKLDGIMFGQKATMMVDEGRIVFGIGDFKVDTNALPEEQRKRIHRLLFGPLMFTMQPNGKVTSSVGFERLQFIIPNFDPQQFFANMPPLLPDEPVAVGETWERRVDMPIVIIERLLPVNFVFKLESTHADEATNHQIANISVSSKAEVQDVETLTQLPQVRKPVKARIDSGMFTIEGEGQFDITDGTIIQVELKFDANFKQSADVPKELLQEEGLIEKEQKGEKGENVTMSVEVKIAGSMQVLWGTAVGK
ncbi:MAG: hypothetical protein RMK18_05545 [Armatimonadota bacterium]|nr:hypothetical protein [Armatimonadota bacterium]MDW8025315.1 hypothetical protein [Armatimonadota bacterium]